MYGWQKRMDELVKMKLLEKVQKDEGSLDESPCYRSPYFSEHDGCAVIGMDDDELGTGLENLRTRLA